MTIIDFIKKEKMNIAAGAFFCLLLALSACNNGNKNDDHQAYEEARSSYAACVSKRGQDVCDRVKGSQGVMSVNDYLGKGSYSNFNGYANGFNNGYSNGFYPNNNSYNNGYNNAYANNRAYAPAATGVYNNGQTASQFVERGYFEVYLKNLPEDTIREMSRRWTDFANYVDNEYNAIRTCTWGNCY